MHRPVVADAETVIRIRWNFLYDAVCVKLSSERTYEGSQPFFYFHFFSFLFLFRFSFLFLFIVLFLFLFKKCSPFKKCSIFQKCSYFQKMFDFHKFVRVFKFCSGVSENCLCFQFFLPAVANYHSSCKEGEQGTRWEKLTARRDSLAERRSVSRA